MRTAQGERQPREGHLKSDGKIGIGKRRVRTSTGALLGCLTDKIAVVLPSNALRDEEKWMAHAKSTLLSAVALRQLQPWRGDWRNFQLGAEFVGELGASAFFQLGRRQAKGNRAVFRLECNPARLTRADIERLRGVLLSFLIEPALLDRLIVVKHHAAADFYGVKVDDVLITYKHVQKFTIVSKTISRRDQLVEEQHFGSMHSDYSGVIYDKSTEKLHRSLMRLLRSRSGVNQPLGSAVVRRIRRQKFAPPVLRFEIRRDKMKGIPIGELRNLENRFHRFKVWDAKALDHLAEPIRTMVICTIREIGLKQTSKLLKGKRVGDTLSMLLGTQCTWWTPEDLWRLAIEHLEGVGLFSMHPAIPS